MKTPEKVFDRLQVEIEVRISVFEELIDGYKHAIAMLKDHRDFNVKKKGKKKDDC